ncbi:MAG: hypothetical protein HZB31_13865 [Nitrospirae bacterium]|nr:hypothetical protein [Nitrospirota bacterium]
MGFKSICLVSLAFLWISSIAYGQTSFSNKDLERYKTKSDSGQGADYDSSKQGSETNFSRETSGDSDKDYWCRQGQQARSEISTANRNAAAAQEQYDDIHARFMTRNTKIRIQKGEVDDARRKQDEAIEEVDRAKKALEQLESEAFRNGIPPGWLNCNFN